MIDAPNHIERLEEVAVCAARRAGAAILRGLTHARSTLEVRHKGPIDLVTEIDLEAERLIIDTIAEAFPSHHVLTEEAGLLTRDEGQLTWIVDPLDGTTNFAHSNPHCAVSIAVARGDEVLAGVIYHPAADELFTARWDGPALLNGRELHVTTQSELGRALLATGFAYDRRERAHAYLPLFEAFLRRSQGVRRMGAACLDLAWLACGRLDGFWEANLSPWDVAAGTLLVSRAGGSISNYDGTPFCVTAPQRLLATNGLLEEAMRGVIDDCSATEDETR